MKEFAAHKEKRLSIMITKSNEFNKLIKNRANKLVLL
jgi:hypothetical protein